MKNRKPPHPVVFDLEFTAWEGSMARDWSAPGELKEVVQIGAVKLDGDALKIVDTFDMLVRPRVNPVLSNYLVDLIGVSNAKMDAYAVDFAIAYRAFLDFVSDAPIWAFGRDDLIFESNLRLYGLERAMPVPPYTNVIPWFAEQGVMLAGKRACDVGPAMGIPFDGHKHNALADAHSVAFGVIAAIKNGAPNPFAAKAKT